MSAATPHPDGPMPSAPAAAQHAFVTLVTNADYALGARALIRSIRLTRTPADIVVLYTGGVDTAALEPLTEFDCRLIETELLPLSDEFNARHQRRNVHEKAPFTKGRKPDFHSPLDNFCKLRLWQLVEYERCVFIDADAIVLRNIDKLFVYPEFSAAPNVYESLADFHRLNSGVFVAKPSLATYENMLAALDAPGAFWPRTDQTFLQSFFPDWHGLPATMNMLQYVWFNLPALWDWRSIGVLHYQYEKPWEKDHPRADVLRPLIELWHAYLTGENIPDITKLENPARPGAGAS
ncbi:alpha-N-acetylglucosamine transferase [Sinorhizobium fredii]|uniref:Glycosyl transferase SqdD n=1 Tax=Sinorhizobium fredii (strain USDA 257) TaxID=1185652 RepID=I3XCX8_SINF2|nr:glycosyltransferase [Sinorhizobium fredii]AFL53734.1 glycosyl transferase SqdD [Sinorhizobium fredii USDA 257]